MNSALDQLQERAKKARNVADQWLPALREAYLYEMPERYYQMSGGDSRTSSSGQRAYYDHIFDPVGMHALDDGGHQIADAIHPLDQEFIRWRPRDDIADNDKDAARQRADQFTEVVGTLIARSNFSVEAPKAHKDFLISTGFLHVDRHPEIENRIRCVAMPAYQWAIDEASDGRIQGKFRTDRPKARELPFLYGGLARWSPEAQKIVADEPDKEVEVCIAYTFDAKARLWQLTVFEEKTKHVVYEATYRSCPVICYRHGAVAGQIWGAGPGLRALPDIKTANKVVELTLKNASIAVTGIWQADDDGVLNPSNIRLTPGAIIPKAVGSNGLQPLTAPGDFNVSDLVLQDLRTNVRRSFYVTRVEEREMTAEEYRGRLGQQLREMRGAYGQLRSEFVEPLANRVLDIASEMGLVQRDDLDELVELQLTGPLAQDVRTAQIERVHNAFADIASIAGPEAAVATVKLEELVPLIVDERGADKSVFKNKAELTAFAQQVQQIVAQLLAQQQAGAPAE